MSHTFAHHHREIRARAGDSKQMDQGDSQKFGQVHGGSPIDMLAKM
jgi:hypothetical protein